MLFFPWRDETLELLNTDITQIYQSKLNEIKTNSGKYVCSDAKQMQRTYVSDNEGDGNNNRNEYNILNDRTNAGDIDSPDDEGTVKPKKKLKNLQTFYLCKSFTSKCVHTKDERPK